MIRGTLKGFRFGDCVGWSGCYSMPFWYQDPLDTTDPAIFLQDGNSINYCDLPVLDGSGRTADEIPSVYTRGAPTLLFLCLFCPNALNRLLME